MMKFHLLYTNKNGEFQNEEKEFPNFIQCEQYLRGKGATYWEIGVPPPQEPQQ